MKGKNIYVDSRIFWDVIILLYIICGFDTPLWLMYTLVGAFALWLIVAFIFALSESKKMMGVKSLLQLIALAANAWVYYIECSNHFNFLELI